VLSIPSFIELTIFLKVGNLCPILYNVYVVRFIERNPPSRRLLATRSDSFQEGGRVCSREWGVSHREESNSNEERVNELNKALLYF